MSSPRTHPNQGSSPDGKEHPLLAGIQQGNRTGGPVMGSRKPRKQAIIQTVNGFLLLSCHAKPVAEGTLVSTRGASTGQPYRYRHLQGHWFSQPHSRAVTANTSPALVGVLGISVFKCSRLLVVQGTPVTRRAGDHSATQSPQHWRPSSRLLGHQAGFLNNLGEVQSITAIISNTNLQVMLPR